MKSVITCTLIGLFLIGFAGFNTIYAQNCESRFLESFKKEAADLSLNEAITTYNGLINDKKTDGQIREKAIKRLEACYLRLRYQAEAQFRDYLIERLENLTSSLNRGYFSVRNYKSVKSF